MDEFQDVLSHADQQCNARGSRFTPKRKKVLLTLLASDKALSAYELAAEFTKKFDETLPTMSIYRILDFLQEISLVHKLELANKYVACSHISCKHAHEIPQFLICRQCHKVKEIGISSGIFKEIEQKMQNVGYHLNAPQFEMNCLCDSCFPA